MPHLTEARIRARSQQRRPYKLYDARGLYLRIETSGSAPVACSSIGIGGKEKLLALGAYPYVSLKRAREKRDEARTLSQMATTPRNRSERLAKQSYVRGDCCRVARSAAEAICSPRHL